MLYTIEARDKKDHLDLRLKTRPAHLEYIKSLSGDIVFGGPFLDESEKPTGSFILLKAESLDKAKIIAKNDPYNKVGLFEIVEVRAFNLVFNNS
jgi:hypothetical protein